MAIRSKVSILGAIAGAGILATLLLGASPAAQRTAARDALQYFPYPDRRSFGAEGEALLAKAARERRADAPNVADAIQYLSQRERYAEALSLARDATRTQPARIREIARAMARLGVEVPFRDTHIALREPLAALIRDMRARLKELPREDAARAARAVLELEDPRRRNAGGLRAFATEYAGTEEAELAEVDLLPGALDPAGRLKALEAFARERPGTVAAAKALYMRGEETGHAFGQGAPDPTERFMSVVKVVAELESGKFPPCEWVDRAPDLVNYFLAPRAKYSPENVDRVLETYKQFMLKHLDSLTESLAGGPPSLLTHELPELFAVKGVANGVERLLDELERESADPDAVRLIRASYDFYSGGRPVDEAARNAGIERSRRALEEIGSHAGSRWRAPALAILASQQFERRNYAAAIVAYRGYLAANPDSASSWVAAIRVGQAQAESGDLAAARQSLRAAASTHGSRPVARFVALAFAAQASAGLGDFESELADLKQALTAWDPDYGSTFTFGLERPAYLGAAPSVLLRSLQREKLV
jgi:hypothetical protein